VALALVRTRAEFRDACEAARRSGQRVGLVPTMGALHAGHMSLVAATRARGAQWIALTIFVNPLQFAPTDDLDEYPRTLEADLDACRAVGVDCVFAPEEGGMYPPGFCSDVRVRGVTDPLEGEHREGHFDGVTTVVSKLFNLAGPCVAAFGRKDYQQWRTLARMVTDLDMPIEVVGAPIVREADGLALSSRNTYLSEDARERALGLVTGLRSAWDAFEAGERSGPSLLSLARAPIVERFDSVDYVGLVSPENLSSFGEVLPDRALLAVAAHIGSTRLIDNVVLGEDPRPG